MDLPTNLTDNSDEDSDESKLFIDVLGEDLLGESDNSSTSLDSSFAEEVDKNKVMANQTGKKQIMNNPNLCLDEEISSIKAQCSMLKTGTSPENDNEVEVDDLICFESMLSSPSSKSSFVEEVDNNIVMENPIFQKIMNNPNLCLDEKLRSIKAQHWMLKRGANYENFNNIVEVIDDMGEDLPDKSKNSFSCPDSSFGEKVDSNKMMANQTVQKIMKNPNLCLDEKISSIKAQYRMLKTGTNCEYNNKVEELRKAHEEKLLLHSNAKESELERAENFYIKDKHNARIQYSKKCEKVKRHLIRKLEKMKRKLKEEMEEKKKNLLMEALDEKDRKKLNKKSTHHMNLRKKDQSSSSESEAEEQAHSIEKIQYLLTQSQINEDLDIVYRAIGEKKEFSESSASTSKPTSSGMRQESIIKNGKLFHNKKWYHRGQAVFIEYTNKKRSFPGLITAISKDTVLLNDTSSADAKNKRFTLQSLKDGEVNIKWRDF